MKDHLKNWIRDSEIKLLLIFFALIYLLSFFLPAYSAPTTLSGRVTLSGYECALIAFAVVFDASADIDGGFFVQIFTKGHFLLLGLHNVIVPACLMLYKKMAAGHFRWAVNILAISVLNVILFFFYNYFGGQNNYEALLSGYYVWAFASLMIYVIMFIKLDMNDSMKSAFKQATES